MKVKGNEKKVKVKVGKENLTSVEKRRKRKMEENKRWRFRKGLKRNKIQKTKKESKRKSRLCKRY